jgi:hypothetical protein
MPRDDTRFGQRIVGFHRRVQNLDDKRVKGLLNNICKEGTTAENAIISNIG